MSSNELIENVRDIPLITLSAKWLSLALVISISSVLICQILALMLGSISSAHLEAV